MTPTEFDPYAGLYSEEAAALDASFARLHAASAADKARRDAMSSEERAAYYAEQDAEIDRIAADLDARNQLWEQALKRWGLPAAIIEGDGEYYVLERPEHAHPLAEAYWGELNPEEAAEDLNNGKPFTRDDVRNLHNRWKREQARRKEAAKSKRIANRVQFGGVTLAQAEDAIDAIDALRKLSEADSEREHREALKAARAEDPYVHGASLVLSAWKAHGAKMPGVRFDDEGLLSRSSKGVRWFKAVCRDKPPKRVAETAQRMAQKGRWKADWEAFRNFVN